jgi:hypothetical protein
LTSPAGKEQYYAASVRASRNGRQMTLLGDDRGIVRFDREKAELARVLRDKRSFRKGPPLPKPI